MSARCLPHHAAVLGKRRPGHAGGAAHAGLAPEDIGYINAHGTATPANDLTETAAIRAVFGAHAGSLAVSSTKSMHGHALGAAAALEFLATVLALRDIPHQARCAQEYAISNSFNLGD